MSVDSTSIACVACGEPLSMSVRKGSYEYLICRRCGTAAMHPLPGDAEIVEHYRRGFAAGNYELLRRFAGRYEVVYRGFLEMIQQAFASQGRSLQGVRLMDVGCFTADFLAIAAEAGCDVIGFELQDEAVAIAQERLPGRVHQIDVHDRGLDGSTYDAICLFGVIEHVRDPIGLLTRCSVLLRPGGWIFLQTPNRTSLPARLLGKYWPPYSPVEHLHLFSQAALVNALAKNGCEVKLVRPHWKRLPVEYVFEMMHHYGPEIRALLKPLYSICPKPLRAAALPFYAGEIVIAAKRASGLAG